MLKEMGLPETAIQQRLAEVGQAAGYDPESFRRLQAQLDAVDELAAKPA